MSNLARKRWELLGKILKRGRCGVDGDLNAVSVRRFTSFGLVKTQVSECKPCAEDGGHCWFRYTYDHHTHFSADIRHLDGSVTFQDLLGFNNTGNVCVWPSEEVLLHYCLQNLHLFRGKKVIELGGGMTCLAGLAVAQCGQAEEVLLTDGNSQSIQNVDVTLRHNADSFGETQVRARTLLWDQFDQLGPLEEHFDVVICADCFFFDEYRDDLCSILLKLLKPGGTVISFAPSRNKTFHLFENLARQHFAQVTTEEKYDDLVWKLHQQNKEQGCEVYDEAIHYPLLMTLTKASFH